MTDLAAVQPGDPHTRLLAVYLDGLRNELTEATYRRDITH